MATEAQLNQVLSDSSRLRTIRALAIFDSEAEHAFDQLTKLASKIIGAPISLISLVDDKRQWFKSMVGLGEPWATQRETPLSYSFCQHVVATQEPLIVSDSREVDFLKDSLAVSELNVIAYLGMPLVTHGGHALGSLCVVDEQPRDWTPEQIDILNDLSDLTMALIEVRARLVDANSTAQVKLLARTGETQRVQAETRAAFRKLLNAVVTMLDKGTDAMDVRAFILSAPEMLA